jgi:hypothetical protein
VLEIHHVAIFEQLVGRGDSRQLLTYPVGGGPDRRFAAFDYGFAFGGGPNWTAASITTLPAPTLPETDPWGVRYPDGAPQAAMITRLRALTANDVEVVIEALAPPRWGLSVAEGAAVIQVILARAKSLVKQFEARNYPLLQVKP